MDVNLFASYEPVFCKQNKNIAEAMLKAWQKCFRSFKETKVWFETANEFTLDGSY